MTQIQILNIDITTLYVDIIVNAANGTLLGGGGVDGAIHRIAGKELLKDCWHIGGCSTGDVKITLGYNLPAKYVIHTVGPRYNSGSKNDVPLLRNCYYNSMKLAVEYGAKSIAFPAISCGKYHYPIDEVAQIAIETVSNFIIKYNPAIEQVIFACSDETYDSFVNTLKLM